MATWAALLGAATIASSPATGLAHAEARGRAEVQARAQAPATATATAAAAPLPEVAALAPATAGASANASANASWSALSARYRVSFQRPGKAAAVQLWELHRAAELIAIRKGPIEDLWWRDGRGAVGLKRVLRDDRAVIEYAPGELKTLQLAFDWEALGTLFDEGQIPALKARGEQRRGGRVVARYAGTLGGEKVDLHWDAQLRLPLKLVRESREGRVQYELLEQHAQAPAGWVAAGSGTEGFERIDASDFGDMEYNPVVRKAESLDVRAGWRGAHGH